MKLMPDPKMTWEKTPSRAPHLVVLLPIALSESLILLLPMIPAPITRPRYEAIVLYLSTKGVPHGDALAPRRKQR